MTEALQRRKTVAQAQAENLTVYAGRPPHVRRGGDCPSGHESLESERETYWADRFAKLAAAVAHAGLSLESPCGACGGKTDPREPDVTCAWCGGVGARLVKP